MEAGGGRVGSVVSIFQRVMVGRVSHGVSWVDGSIGGARSEAL